MEKVIISLSFLVIGLMIPKRIVGAVLVMISAVLWVLLGIAYIQQSQMGWGIPLCLLGIFLGFYSLFAGFLGGRE